MNDHGVPHSEFVFQCIGFSFGGGWGVGRGFSFFPLPPWVCFMVVFLGAPPQAAVLGEALALGARVVGEFGGCCEDLSVHSPIEVLSGGHTGGTCFNLVQEGVVVVEGRSMMVGVDGEYCDPGYCFGLLAVVRCMSVWAVSRVCHVELDWPVHREGGAMR